MNTIDDPPFEIRTFGGSRAGPHLFITAGVHGDEYLPMLAVKHLIKRFESESSLAASLRGTVSLVPIVNLAAFRRGSRVAEDGKDLARTCPGKRDGTITEQVAWALGPHISTADYYVDLHTGGKELCVLPLAGYVLHADKVILSRQREMARAFQLPLIWGTSARLQGRTLSVARDAAVPAVYVEYLGAHRELAEVAAMNMKSISEDHPLIAGCINLMRHLNLLEQPPEACVAQDVIEDWRTSSGHMQICNPASTTGFLSPKVGLGQRVTRGDLLAEIVADRGGETHCVVSQQDGIVVAVREYPRIVQGDAVAVVAESCSVA